MEKNNGCVEEGCKRKIGKYVDGLPVCTVHYNMLLKFMNRKPHHNPKEYIRSYKNEARRMASKLPKKPCERCGEPKTDKHHEDYDRPLDVTYLCRKHHIQRHNEMRRERKQRLESLVTELSAA